MSTLKLFPGIKARALLVLALFVSLAGICRAQTNIHEFTLSLPDPSLNFYIDPQGITYGPDGGYWFCMYGINRIGHFNPLASTNRLHVVFLKNGGTNTAPFSIITGPDSNLWFSASSVNQIVRMDPFSSNYVRFTLPYKHTAPWVMANGPDGNIWFSEFNRNRIACISTAPATNANGTLTLLNESPAIETNSEIYGLTAGPDGNMWFTDGTYGTIYRYNLSGTNAGSLTPFPLRHPFCAPVSIVAGPDGALWFTEHMSNTIGRITVDGIVTEFPIPRPNKILPHPTDIIVGPDNNLWFTMKSASSIGRMTTNGAFTIYPTPTPSAAPTYLATGTGFGGSGPTDTNIYFCENVGNAQGVDYKKLGRLLVGESLTLELSTGFTNTGTTAVSGQIATFYNSGATNRVSVFWGDGTSNSVRIASITPGASVTSNSLTITNVVGIDRTNGANGTYEIFGSHTYPASVSNYVVTIVVNDPRQDYAFAHGLVTISPNTPLAVPDPFFDGQVGLSNKVDYLQFPDGADFGYYTLAYFPYLYHFDMGFEYFMDGNDGQGGVYLYDFTSGDYFYTSPTLFPYLYDFTLNAWLYYYPDTNNEGHYTTNPRSFYNFATSQIITR